MIEISALLDSIPTDLWIGGERRPASGGQTFPVRNPATGETLVEVADAQPEDGARALDAAAQVQANWAATPPRQRADILRRAWEMILQRRDEFALLMTLEMGKPLGESQGEVNVWCRVPALVLRRSGADQWSLHPIAVRERSNCRHKRAGRANTRDHPVELPPRDGTRRIAPAFAAGCTMVVKPAAETPLTMLLLSQVLPAGLPAGVLSIPAHLSVTEALTSPILEDERLRKLTFTGSTGVGKMLLRRSATRVLRTHGVGRQRPLHRLRRR